MKKIISGTLSFLLVLSLLLTGSIQGLATIPPLELDENQSPLIESIEAYIAELMIEVNEINPEYEITAVEVILDSEGEIYSVSYLVDLSAEAELEHQRQLDDFIREAQIEMGENPRMRQSGLEFRSVLQNSTLRWSGYRRAGNQNACGFNHGNVHGASINWNGSGGGSISVDLGVSWTGFGGSVSISAGRSGVAGHNIPVPSSLRNQPVHLNINHQVSVRTYRVYTRTPANPQWAFNSRQTFTAINSQRAQVVRAPASCR